MRALPFLIVAVALGSAPAAAEVDLEGQLIQGGLVRGLAPPGAQVRLDGRAVRVSAEGLFVIGFGRDAPRRARLEVRTPDGARQRLDLEITQRQYPTERIDGLPPKMVTPSAEALVRIREEAARIALVRQRDTGQVWFAGGFAWPVIGRISGVYGSQRILNGEPRRPHYGVDIAAPTGTPVAAPAAGVVALAEDDLYFTGGTVMIDHGHGLSSVFSHLSKVGVRVGQMVAQGEAIGALGATGRVTGPHLDWRVNWFTERLDPALLAGPMPAK